MKNFNLIIDSITLYLYLYFVSPIIMLTYESLGAELPTITKLFLIIAEFWSSLNYFPIILYLIFSLVAMHSFRAIINSQYIFLFRLPLLISLIGSIVFLSLPITAAI